LNRLDNPERVKAYNQRYHEEDRYSGRIKWYNIKREYGLTQIDWEDMLSDQEGKCPGCGAENVEFHVDHDHSTGRIRGLLCERCNWAAGNCGDNPQTLRNLADYIERSL
jgi:hypothetical protein